MVPEDARGRITGAMDRLRAFLKSQGIKELEPGSLLFRELDGPEPPGLGLLSVGGTTPELFSLYTRVRSDGRWREFDCASDLNFFWASPGDCEWNESICANSP